MTASELRKKYLDFFVSKGHVVIPGASLIPEHDPSVLFTTAGMHPLVPFLLGQPHPAGKRITNIQKCVRTDDIEEVGDFIHHTFFEMMGNWSLGDYFKQEIIAWSHEFVISSQWLGLDARNLAVSVFAGDNDAPFDQEAYDAWRSLGISEQRIARLPKKSNWWGPAGKTGPCGPDTEMFYWTGNGLPAPDIFDPEDIRWVEIGNNVFMQYNKTEKEVYEMLAQKNVDVGWGLDRMLAVANGYFDDYKTEQFTPIISEIERLSGKTYQSTEGKDDYAMRIIADHIRAATFLLAEQLEPSNSEQGYVLRRLIRRAVRYGVFLDIKDNFCSLIGQIVVVNYQNIYPELIKNKDFIVEQLNKEEARFSKTLQKGLSILSKELKAFDMKESGKIDHEIIDGGPIDGFIGFTPQNITGEWLFNFYQTFGFPFEMALEEIEKMRRKFQKFELEKIIKEYQEASEKHQELSRAGAAQKFKGGLADHSEQTTRYHTATHLLQAALRQVLGVHVRQMGSNITAERMRFDFSHPGEVSPEQIKTVEELVNEKISRNLGVQRREMTNQEADQLGALSVSRAAYGDQVSVYSVTDGDTVFSIEKCGGPHVSRTGELGVFTIKKFESIGQGIKRIKAILV